MLKTKDVPPCSALYWAQQKTPWIGLDPENTIFNEIREKVSPEEFFHLITTKFDPEKKEQSLSIDVTGFPEDRRFDNNDKKITWIPLHQLEDLENLLKKKAQEIGCNGCFVVDTLGMLFFSFAQVSPPFDSSQEIDSTFQLGEKENGELYLKFLQD